MKTITLCLALALSLSFSHSAFSQNFTLSGNIKNSIDKDVVPAVSITIKGTSFGTFSDEKGNFKVNASSSFPLTLVFTSIGFESKELIVNSASDFIQVDFVPASSLGAEVVVSASRVPERILESPVSIERISAANIRNTPSTSYYDMLRLIKGVDITLSSLTFSTPTTRGFSYS
ncbi:MAG: carboxypeptidase-like regulatory domain-containing protein, partial [Flavitalea sp.]